MQNALRCLARHDPTVRSTEAGRWQQTTIRLRGEVNAARVWSLLRTKSSGRLALQAAAQRRVKISVQTSERSRVTLRATRAKSYALAAADCVTHIFHYWWTSEADQGRRRTAGAVAVAPAAAGATGCSTAGSTGRSAPGASHCVVI